MNKIKKYMKQMNNDGSALVIAIVVIGFVSILTTVLLYLASMNYQMKSTDHKTKVSFYGAEIPLEELRTCLVMDVSAAANEAYSDVIYKYNTLSGNVRNTQYQTAFKEEFIDIWEKRTTDPTDSTIIWNWEEGIKNALIFDATSSELIAERDEKYHIIDSGQWDGEKCNKITCTCPYHIILEELVDDEGKPLPASERLEIHEKKEINEEGVEELTIYFDLKGLRVIYTEDSFTTDIETSFRISVPAMEWGVDQYSNEWTTDDKNNKAQNRIEVNMENSVIYLDWFKN